MGGEQAAVTGRSCKERKQAVEEREKGEKGIRERRNSGRGGHGEKEKRL